MKFIFSRREWKLRIFCLLFFISFLIPIQNLRRSSFLSLSCFLYPRIENLARSSFLLSSFSWNIISISRLIPSSRKIPYPFIFQSTDHTIDPDNSTVEWHNTKRKGREKRKFKNRKTSPETLSSTVHFARWHRPVNKKQGKRVSGVVAKWKPGGMVTRKAGGRGVGGGKKVAGNRV